jgi:putative N-acetyltransferase (TIGR04045 family)
MRLGVTACRFADDPWTLEQHHRIRHDVFVGEQRLFVDTDLDRHDDDPATIKVLGLVDDEPAGAVRLFPLDPARSLWQGDRLSVRRSCRGYNTGVALVRFAVATAGHYGGAVMTAHIQLANVGFFERLGWRRAGSVEVYVGVDHQPMAIDLTRG